MTVSVLWVNFGPYHFARLAALRSVVSVLAIELSTEQRLYGWPRPKGEQVQSLHTLTVGEFTHGRSLKVCVKLWRLLRAMDPGVLLVPGYTLLPALLMAFWGRVNGKLVVLMSESGVLDLRRSHWKERAKRLLLSHLFDKAIVGGQRHEQYLRSLGFSGEVQVGYDVVDNEGMVDGCARLRLAGRPPGLPGRYFLYVGRLAEEKNISLLLDAFAEYRALGHKWELMIVGDGPLRTRLEQAGFGYGLSHVVHFKGRLFGDALMMLFAFASAFVLPSKSEPWGLVINEAMASSLPVVVSDVCGCVDELVEESVNGFPFRSCDRASLTARLIEIGSMSDSDLERMGYASLDRIRHYGLDRWQKGVLELVSSRS